MLLTVILLSHNRPNLARQAINSITNQSVKNFKFIVSDNSTNFELSNIMENEFPLIEYISWYPGVSLETHFTELMKLIDTRYFVLFHDDDLLEPTYVERILYHAKRMPHAAAIGTNGYIIDNDGHRISSFLHFFSKENIIYFDNSESLIKQYLSSEFNGVAPFSSYVYNAELIKDVPLGFSQANKYFDTIFLSNIAHIHLVVWINESLVRIRYHDNRVSTRSGVRDYKAFITLVRKKYNSSLRQCYIDEYRLVHLYYELKNRDYYPVAALKFFTLKSLALFFISSGFRKRLAKYVVKKILKLS